MQSCPAVDSKTRKLERIALIDWLSFSVVPTAGNALQWINELLISLFGISQECWKPTGRGWFGYSARINLGEFGLLAYGGESQNGSVHVELNAHACARLKNWVAIQEWGEKDGARITRVDLAHDDFEGKTVNIEIVRRWFDEGGFTTSGRPPKAQLVDDLGSGDGKTFYIGKRAHGKLTRGYEKGKQLGDPQSPWFRIEVELHNKGRTIPWDVLTRPGCYLAGAYPCLNYLCIEQDRIKTVQRAFSITYEQMEKWVGLAAGKALNVMLTAHYGDTAGVLARVVRSGAPKRLSGFTDEDRVELTLP